MTDAPECFQPVSAHTPTPWRVFTNPDGTKLVGIGAEAGQGILDAGFGVWAWNDAEGIANAELVVEAVNIYAITRQALENYDALHDALLGLIEAVELDSDKGGKGISGYTAARLHDAREALALSRPTSGGAA